jgi:putative transposase
MKLTAINQLWVADITYIRLRQEFVYLALVLDAFSRKVVGWALDRSLTARLPPQESPPDAQLELALIWSA